LKEKDEFIQIIEENEDTLQKILYDVLSDTDRKNIALRLWAGCLDAAKTLRDTYVSEHNPDGNTKKEEHITPKARNTAFTKVDPNAKKDPIYNAGVESAPVWELKLKKTLDKKIYVEGVPQESTVWRYIIDKNRKIISADDIKISLSRATYR
jgi:hypothetical protein